MADSDDDEFLSASEGEYDEADKNEKSKSSPAPQQVEILDVEVETSPPPEKKEEAELKQEVVEKLVDSGSSQESLLDENNFSASRSSGSESHTDSLSSENKRLLEEVVKETLSEDHKEETPIGEEPTKDTWNTNTEKSMDDGGWDDFEMDSSTLETSKKEDKTPEATPQKIEVTDKAPEPRDEDKRPMEHSLDDGGWDDWAEDAPEKKKSAADGWNDWSLIDEKKVEKDTPKKTAKKEDPWFQEKEEQKPKQEKKTAGWGWGGLVSAVGETFTSTIESSLGLPSAEQVARRHAQQQKEMEQRLGAVQLEDEPEQAGPSSTTPQLGFGMLSGLVSGGIDVLESIGKKTFEAVTVKDEKAGRRRMLFTEESGQNLSDVLRELRERQDKESSFPIGSAAAVKQAPDVAAYFGVSEGMAHLEALEMLSGSRPKPPLKFEKEYHGALAEVDVERVEDGDFEQLLSAILKRINLPYEPKNLLNCDSEISTRLAWCDGKSGDELFADAVQSLVDFTASSVQVVSKLANLLLILRQGGNYRDFVSLFTLLAQRINHITSQYTDAISMTSDSAKADDLVTQTHVESSTATDFIRQAHRLLAPMFHNL